MSRDPRYGVIGAANALMGRGLASAAERPKSPYKVGSPEDLLWSKLQDVLGEVELYTSMVRDYEARRTAAEAQVQALKNAIATLTGKEAG